MVKVSKIINNTIKPLSKNSCRVRKGFSESLKTTNLGMLSKSMLCLGVLGLATLTSCDPVEPIIDDYSDWHEDIILIKKFDNILNNLGLLVNPNTSVNDISTINFKSDKNENFYFKVENINNSSILIKQIKFDSNLAREDSLLTIMQNDSGIEIIKICESDVENIKFQVENDSVKSYVMQDGIWIENAILKNKAGDITIYNKDGSELRFFDIKNNIDFPEDLYFAPPEEVDDEVVFGL